MSEHKPETDNETYKLPDNIVDQVSFKTGLQFCTPAEELEAGDQCIETFKLSAERQGLYGAEGLDEAKKPVAETRVVSIVDVIGHTVTVAALYYEDGEVKRAKSEVKHTVTPEGWFIPKALLEDEDKAFLSDMAEETTGYLTLYDGPVDGNEEEAMVERKQVEEESPLEYLRAEPPSQEEQDRYWG